MAKRLVCSLVVIMGMMVKSTYAQSLFSPRAIAVGAYGPLVDDTRSFTENAAGIVNMRDWDLSVATYLLNIHTNQAFVFQGISLGKRFLDRYALALQYSPGTSMEFAVPPSLTLTGTSPTSVDQSISYEEPFAAGMAVKIVNELSLGLASRYRAEKVVDTQYQLVQQDTGFTVQRLPDVEHKASGWHFDVGLLWKPLGPLTFALVGQNVVEAKSGPLPSEFDRYSISNKRAVKLGAAYKAALTLTFTGEYSSSNTGACGLEWSPGLGIAVRGGAYMNGMESPFFHAMGVGVGWKYGFFDADVSYLRFISQDGRQGAGLISDFDPSGFGSIDLNPYSSDRLQLSLKAMFGNVRQVLARIEAVEITGSIYPSELAAMAYRPLGNVRVKNISDQPIEARTRFYVEQFMDDPTESQPVHLLPGEIREIPITAVFNDRMKTVERMIVREGNIYVSATADDDYDDKYVTPVLIHGKNDWDGSAYSLRYFVTPDDPAVIRYTRDVLLAHRDSLNSVSSGLESFHKAKLLFDTFAGKLVYVSDPKQSADYVQYPAETLQLRGGDCDDMTTCFSSLLNSIGISTAFVDVVPPEDSSKSHIYLMFDSGLGPQFTNLLSTNTKRYVIRKNQKGAESIWIPIETTMITKGFDTAWSQGAQEYFEEAEVRLGLIKGWVRIVDVY